MPISDENERQPKDPDLRIVERLAEAMRNLKTWSHALARDETWAELESLLAALGVAEAVSEVMVPIKTFEVESPDPFCSQGPWMLGLLQLGDRWSLCLGCGPEDIVEYWEHPWAWKPITECTLSERQQAAIALPKLLDAIASNAEDSDVSQALATLKQALANLRRVLEKRGDGGQAAAGN